MKRKLIKRRRALCFVVLLTLLLTSNLSAEKLLSYYISPKGSDKNSGVSEKAPFKTFEKTLDVVSKIPKPWTSDIIVNVMPGDYFLNSTIELNSEHSGKGKFKLVFKNLGKLGSPVLVGGQKVDNKKWIPYKDGIYYQDLPTVERIEIIYEERRKARKARIPNYEFLKDFPITDGKYFISGVVGKKEPFITASKKDLSKEQLTSLNEDLKDQVQAYLVTWGHGSCDWHKWIYPITHTVPETGRIFVSEKKPNFHQGRNNKGNRYYIEGGIRLLDAKGEFYFDKKIRRLYYKPFGDLSKNEVLYSTMKNMVTINSGRNIVFDGIKFTCSGVLPFTDSAYTWTDTDAAIAIDKSESIEILNCHFQSIGQTAINLVSTHKSRIENCLMQYLGQSGIKIYFSDYNTIRNNLIHDIGLRRSYCEGVSIHSSKNNRISHLEIFNSARYGITMRGKVVSSNGSDKHPTRDNVVEYIKIYDVNQDSGDSGGLHMARLNAEKGENFVNYFNQITVTRSIAQPNITDEWKPTGVYLDHKKMVMNQSMKNIEVKAYDPRYKGYEVKRFGGIYGKSDRTSAKQKQIMQNRPWNNESSTKFNCSWQKDFDPKHMEYSKIGLTKDFPKEYLKVVMDIPAFKHRGADTVGSRK